MDRSARINTAKNRLDAAEEMIEFEELMAAEEDIVTRHDGGVNIVPAVIVEELAVEMVDAIEDDVYYDREVDAQTARRAVILRSLLNSIEDYWNGYYD